MKIAVNGKSFGVTEHGGAVGVALRVVANIAAQAPLDRIDVYTPEGRRVDLGFLPDAVRTIPSRFDASRTSFTKSLWEQIDLPLSVGRRSGYDVLLNLTNSAPVLIPLKTPQVLLVHDVGFLNPEWFSQGYRRYVGAVLRRAVKNGTRLVTVSEASADQLREAFAGLEHVSVIPNGIDDPPSPIGEAVLPYRYLLFLGSLNPRKNLQGLLKAFQVYRRQSRDPLKLVIVGAEKKLFAKQQWDGALQEDVEYLGYVDSDTKWALLDKAEALILTSFMEGFGLPIGEALRLGVPVIASDLPVFRELYGGLPEYADPRSPEDIARAISDVVESLGETRAKIARNAPRLLERFRWSAVGGRYRTLIQQL